jgi:hypothetical protein
MADHSVEGEIQEVVTVAQTCAPLPSRHLLANHDQKSNLLLAQIAQKQPAT